MKVLAYTHFTEADSAEDDLRRHHMDGAITLFKPSGITSFKATEQVKRITGVKKCGHGGTLDPVAEGVLPIFLGKATKVIPFIKNNDKAYSATIKLGVETDTMDCEGKVVSENPAIVPSFDEVEKAVSCFEGEISQRPPIYSALRYKGKRLYEYARKNIEIEVKKRKVIIDKIEIVFYKYPLLKINVYCSSGTYIRSLAHDIGEVLGCGGHIVGLLRTKSGDFHIKEAVNIDSLKSESSRKALKSHIKGIDEILAGYGEVKVSDEVKQKVLCGSPVEMDDVTAIGDCIAVTRLLKVKDSDNNLLAIAEIVSVKADTTGSEKNLILKMKRVFN